MDKIVDTVDKSVGKGAEPVHKNWISPGDVENADLHNMGHFGLLNAYKTQYVVV